MIDGYGVGDAGLATAYTLKSSDPMITVPSLAIAGEDRTGPEVENVHATAGATPGEPSSPTTV